MLSFPRTITDEDAQLVTTPTPSLFEQTIYRSGFKALREAQLSREIQAFRERNRCKHDAYTWSVKPSSMHNKALTIPPCIPLLDVLHSIHEIHSQIIFLLFVEGYE